MESKRAAALAGLDIANLRGVEIGPLESPIVLRNQGTVFYVDHVDTEGLRTKYMPDPNVNVERIVDVDFVWGERTLKEIVGDQVFDYVVASHVIEHVPNVLGWLNEIELILRQGGELRLVIPDRRFTFDFFRRESGMSDVLSALLADFRAPSPRQIIDHFSDLADVNAAEAWRTFPVPPDIAPKNGDVASLALARQVVREGGYHDVHCWVFTPASFVEIMLRTARLQLHRFACTFLKTTPVGQLEFYCGMRLEDDNEAVVDSWSTIAETLRRDVTPHANDAEATIARLRVEGDAAKARLEEIEGSRAWRAVLLYRRIKRLLESLRRR